MLCEQATLMTEMTMRLPCLILWLKEKHPYVVENTSFHMKYQKVVKPSLFSSLRQDHGRLSLDLGWFLICKMKGLMK